jgi:hypothetical protein
MGQKARADEEQRASLLWAQAKMARIQPNLNLRLRNLPVRHPLPTAALLIGQCAACSSTGQKAGADEEQRAALSWAAKMACLRKRGQRNR